MNVSKKSARLHTGWWVALIVVGAGIAAFATGDAASPATPQPEAAATEPADAQPASQQPADASKGISGRVKQVLEVESYTYVLLDRGDDEVWAAVPKATIAVGEQVALQRPTRMDDFESKTLGRRFEVIYFGTLASEPQLPAGHPGSTAAPASASPVEIGNIARAPGDGGRTVAEIFSKRAQLAGRRVSVAARVVKVTPAVLDRTWLHVRDGSGSASSGDHDLIVTTSTVPSVGDEVLIVGTVTVNKDLGSGYRYDVLVEDAVVTARGEGGKTAQR